MKKKILSIFGCFVAVIAIAVIGLYITANNNVAFAAEGDEPIIEKETLLNQDYFASQELYAALIKTANTVSGLEMSEVTYGTFENYTSLDLSYETTGYKITSLDGIEYLFLGSNLKTVNLSGNKLTTVDTVHFGKMLYVEDLDLSNNSLVSCNLPTTLKLKSLNLKNNQLTQIDLSNMQNDTSTNKAVCDLSLNDFEDVSQIILPDASTTTIQLSLAQNYLTDAKPSDFNDHEVSLQLQGIKVGTTKSVSNTYFTATPDTTFGNLDNLVVKIYYRNNSEYFVDSSNREDNLVVQSDSDGKVVLKPGKMYVEFYNGDTLLTEENSNGMYYSYSMDVYPNAPKMVVLVDNKVIEYEVGQGIKKDFEVVATTSIDGAKTYISLGGGEYQEGNSASIKQRGTYTVSAYLTYDGLKSEIGSLTVRNTNSTGITWGLIIVVGIIIIVIAALVLVRWFKGGAIVSPLTDNEIRRIENKNSKKNKDN